MEEFCRKTGRKPARVSVTKALDPERDWFIYETSKFFELARPALAALLIFSFRGAWNDFTYPLIVTNTDNMKVLSLGILGFKGLRAGMTQWHLMMAAATLSILPMILVFLVAQKYFIEGITVGGLKE